MLVNGSIEAYAYCSKEIYLRKIYNMNKRLLKVFSVFALLTLVYVGCKKDGDDDGTTPVTATCTDGIMNGTETGIDCGGTCTPCTSCSDGIQNGSETDIDCGGACTACAAKSMTADITVVGAFVADTALNNTDSTFDAVGGFTTYRIFAPSGPSAAITFDLTVRFTNSLASVAPNVYYNIGNTGGVYVTLIYKTTTSGITSTYNTTVGRIKFTKINHTAHTLSGVFDLTCNYSGTTRTITNGVFTNLKLK